METLKPVTLLLVRHGQAQSNVSRILTSYPEVRPMPLTPKGRRQSEQLAKKLEGTSVTALFASPLARTQETAEIISQTIGVPVVTDHRIRETDFGIYNNKSAVAFFLRYPRPSLRVTTSAKSQVEGLASVRLRLEEFLKEVRVPYAGKTLVLVTHSDIIHELVGMIRGTGRYEGAIEPGSIHTVTLE